MDVTAANRRRSATMYVNPCIAGARVLGHVTNLNVLDQRIARVDLDPVVDCVLNEHVANCRRAFYVQGCVPIPGSPCTVRVTNHRMVEHDPVVAKPDPRPVIIAAAGSTVTIGVTTVLVIPPTREDHWTRFRAQQVQTTTYVQVTLVPVRARLILGKLHHRPRLDRQGGCAGNCDRGCSVVDIVGCPAGVGGDATACIHPCK